MRLYFNSLSTAVSDWTGLIISVYLLEGVQLLCLGVNRVYVERNLQSSQIST